jgi:exodeoxyribonuclease VII large subunit
MSPENILKKGYAIVKINNKITSNPKTIKLGSSIEIIVADKIITSTVTKKTDYDGKEFNL